MMATYGTGHSANIGCWTPSNSSNGKVFSSLTSAKNFWQVLFLHFQEETESINSANTKYRLLCNSTSFRRWQDEVLAIQQIAPPSDSGKTKFFVICIHEETQHTDSGNTA